LGDRDFKKAFKLYQSAAVAGNEESMYELAECFMIGKGTTKSPQKAFKWYLKSAESGFRKANAKVAQCYLTGNGVRKDEAKGQEWMMQSGIGYKSLLM
jgi:TPR repeat protein